MPEPAVTMVPKSWYAVQVRPAYEKMVASALRDKGYEELLPTCHCKRRWSDRIKEIESPLFSGYLFCHLDISHRLPVLVTPGVIRFVGIGKTPIPIDGREMSSLISIVRLGVHAVPHPYLQIGQRVRIDRGLLLGIEGILTDVKKTARLVVSISLLQRSIAIEIDENWVCPVVGLDRSAAVVPTR